MAQLGGVIYNSSSAYVATVKLQSTGIVIIENATIVGTNISATNISNRILTVGDNTVTLYFPHSNSFTPEELSVYQVSVVLSDGTTVQVVVSYRG